MPFLVLPLIYALLFTPSLIYTLLFTPYCLRNFLRFFRSPHLFGKFFLPSFLRLFSRIFRLRNFLDFFLYSPLLLFSVFSPFYFSPFITPSYIHSSSNSIVYTLLSIFFFYSFSFFPLFSTLPFRVSSPYFYAIIS